MKFSRTIQKNLSASDIRMLCKYSLFPYFAFPQLAVLRNGPTQIRPFILQKEPRSMEELKKYKALAVASLLNGAEGGGRVYVHEFAAGLPIGGNTLLDWA
jgi:hypothetical protein